MRAHYHGCHIRQWCQGVVSSREFVNLILGLPAESWLKSVAHLESRDAVGDEAVAAQQEVRAMTQRLLRGEVKTQGCVIEMTNGTGKARRTSGPTQTAHKT